MIFGSIVIAHVRCATAIQEHGLKPAVCYMLRDGLRLISEKNLAKNCGC
jgi:hypothetical protein